MGSAAVLDAIVSLQAAVDDVLKHFDNGGLGCLSDEEFAEVATEVEATRRCLQSADWPLIGEVQARDLASKELTRTTTGWLGKAWRLTPGQARARVREAEALGERVALTGEVLAPVRPVIAAARRDGLLDASHVTVMLRAFRELPANLHVEDQTAAEEILVDAARALDANDLTRVARAVVDAIDPDGPEPDDAVPDPRRNLDLKRAQIGVD